jgi:LacI family transcriptional regulator
MPDEPRTGAAGQVSIKDIAAHLGMSHATVSRALNGKSTISEATKIRVRRAAAALGYVANAAGRQLRGMPGRLVGLIIPDVQNDFYSTVAKVLAASCAAEGFQLILAISEDDSDLEYRHVLSLLEARVSGVVITPTADLSARTAALLRSLPTIQLIRSHPALPACHVGIDDHAGTFLATRHLLSLGHRAIGFIGGAHHLSTGADRYAGYRDALVAAGCPISDALVMTGPPRPEFGQAAIRTLWSRPDPPSALVLGSSQLTLGAMLNLAERGLACPRDVSLVGYGDPPWFALMTAPVTTIGLPVTELSKAALSILLANMRRPPGSAEPPPSSQTFPPMLVTRGSTAQHPALMHGSDGSARSLPAHTQQQAPRTARTKGGNHAIGSASR